MGAVQDSNSTGATTGTWRAHQIVAAVRDGSLSAVAAVTEALARVAAQTKIGAVQDVFESEALAAAAALDKRSDLAALPLAGLPILIKDNVAVAGHPLREGSQATADLPEPTDHEIVRRLRAAGAIVIGTTRVPELCVWATTDSVFGTTHNPWNPAYSPGGSSGGAAAAVAAGIVPVAHGNDGMGSIRIPAANTGLFGIKPGRGVVPAQLGHDSWGGMAENGPLAQSVRDAALVLSVMADRPELANVTEPAAPLRIAIAPGTPSPIVKLSRPWRDALVAATGALREAGHTVTFARFPYPANPLPLLARWAAGTADNADSLDFALLARPTRGHVRAGRVARRLGLVKQRDADSLAAAAHDFFTGFDVLLTPALARFAPEAAQWHRRSWARNLWSNLQYAPYAAPWNMVGWPAASIPVGFDSGRNLPTAVQAVAPPGGEGLLLGLAAQLERIRPWPLGPDRATS